MGQIVEQLESTKCRQQSCIVAVLQDAERAEQLFQWISRQGISEMHLILVHVANEPCAQTLPVSAFTATRVIARQEDDALRVVAALEKLKRRIADQFPEANVEYRILNGDVYKSVARVIAETKAQQLVLTQKYRNFSKKIPCSVEFIAG